MNDTWVFEVMPFGDDLGIIRAGNSLIAQMIGSPDDGIREREGRLMAAAPDLLGAAHGALECLLDNCKHECVRARGYGEVCVSKLACSQGAVITQLKAVIAKAQGREEDGGAEG